MKSKPVKIVHVINDNTIFSTNHHGTFIGSVKRNFEDTLNGALSKTSKTGSKNQQRKAAEGKGKVDPRRQNEASLQQRRVEPKRQNDAKKSEPKRQGGEAKQRRPRTPTTPSTSHHTVPTQTKKLLECAVCKKNFKTFVGLRVHMKAHPAEETTHECKTCKKQFSKAGNLEKHKKTHDKPKKTTFAKVSYECSFCKKHFADQSALRKHMRTHMSEKKYRCAACNKNFKEATEYRAHMQMHMHMGRPASKPGDSKKKLAPGSPPSPAPVRCRSQAPKSATNEKVSPANVYKKRSMPTKVGRHQHNKPVTRLNQKVHRASSIIRGLIQGDLNPHKPAITTRWRNLDDFRV